jgi:hypothetical protein
MKALHSGREAKELLISQIVEEAQRQNIPLSEVERKMMYFTESGWTLHDIMKVNEDFDREYDQDEYKRKIAKLATKADKRIRKDSRDDYDKWWAAIRFLEREEPMGAGLISPEQSHRECRLIYNHLPSPRQMQTLVQVWKQGRKRGLNR